MRVVTEAALLPTVPPHAPGCMVCGPANAAGLGMRMWADGDLVRGAVRLDERQQGAPGHAHGGAIAAALDDLFGGVAMLHGELPVTASLTVDYRAPVLLGHDLDLVARLDDRDGRKLRVSGEVRDGDVVVAEARALMIAVDRSHWERSGHAIPESWPTP